MDSGHLMKPSCFINTLDLRSRPVNSIVRCYPMEENESGQIKERNYATHPTL